MMGLSFLKRKGLFAYAEKNIQDASFDDLNKRYNQYVLEKKFDDALLIAEKMSILYGFNGLLLYFHISILFLQKEKQQGELIDQEIIKVLSLLFFVERNHLASENNYPTLRKTKEELLSLCSRNSQEEIEAEAADQAAVLKL